MTNTATLNTSNKIHLNTLEKKRFKNEEEEEEEEEEEGCEQVLFVYVSTLIPPCLTDQRNFITVLIVTREPEQTTLLF